jgi:hypothetical protein
VGVDSGAGVPSGEIENIAEVISSRSIVFEFTNGVQAARMIIPPSNQPDRSIVLTISRFKGTVRISGLVSSPP